MNSELQNILARRRQKSEEVSAEEDVRQSIQQGTPPPPPPGPPPITSSRGSNANSSYNRRTDTTTNADIVSPSSISQSISRNRSNVQHQQQQNLRQHHQQQQPPRVKQNESYHDGDNYKAEEIDGYISSSSSDEEGQEQDSNVEDQVDHGSRDDSAAEDDDDSDEMIAQPEQGEKGLDQNDDTNVEDYDESTDDEEKEEGEESIEYEPPPTFESVSGGYSNNNEEEEEEEDVPYEPPPAFDVSTPTNSLSALTLKEGQNNSSTSPLESPPKLPNPIISLKTKNILGSMAKTMKAPPVVNPLTGNFIICHQQRQQQFPNNKFMLKEIEISPQMDIDDSPPVLIDSTPILTEDFRNKIGAKFTSTTFGGIASVPSIATGIHRIKGRSPRVRVAAIIDTYQISLVVDDGKKQQGDIGITSPTSRVLTVWQWGYASSSTNNPVAIQSIMDLPQGVDNYDATSLLVADGLCFLSGIVSRNDTKPCVYVAKTTGVANSNSRETSSTSMWSSNVVSTSQLHKITTMNVTSTAEPYIATGLSDGSVSIFTYKAAMTWSSTSNGSKKKDGLPHLVTLFRLDASSIVSSAQQLKSSRWSSGEDDQDQQDKRVKTVGECKHLLWTAYSNISSPLVVVAAYSNGVALFHVTSPPAETTGSAAVQTKTLKPFSATQFTRSDSEVNTRAVAWVRAGPHAGPCIGILSERSDNSGADDKDLVSAELSVVLGMADLPINDERNNEVKAGVRSLRVFTETTFKTSDSTREPKCIAGILGFNSVSSSIVCYSNRSITLLTPTMSSISPTSDNLGCTSSFFPSMNAPVASTPMGIKSDGTKGDGRDDILHIFTLTNGQKSYWAPLYQRHFLCCTSFGDSPTVKAGGSQHNSDGDADENATGGSSTAVLCELEFTGDGTTSNETHRKGFRPHRIRRCRNSGYCAVLFVPVGNEEDSPVVGASETIDPTRFVLLDTSKEKPQNEMCIGRDITFLPKGADAVPRALVLSENGSSVKVMEENITETGEGVWQNGPIFRSILGTLSLDEYLESRQIFCISSMSSMRIIQVATRVIDGKSCIIAGQLTKTISSQVNDYSMLLPNLESDPVLWLEIGEAVLALLELPPDNKGRSSLAVATQERVMIVSETLSLLASMDVRLHSPSLAPVGSQTVAFWSIDSKIRYLSCLVDSRYSSGVIATLPKDGYSQPLLLALRPDRIIYSTSSEGFRLIEHGNDTNSCLVPIALTRPILVLEPLVGNALCERYDKKYGDVLLRTIIERFGRKMSSLAHGENEGIGNFGAGLTAKVYEMLSAHGYKDPASWLLTGTTNGFDRSLNSEILPPWIPVVSKAHATENGDALLHTLASGDNYLTDYIKSPDKNIPSSLPGKATAPSLFGQKFAKDALLEGDLAGAIKLLDLAGAESSDSDILLLLLSLQLDPFSDTADAFHELVGNANGASSYSGATSSIAALILDLKSRQVNGRIPLKKGECSRMNDQHRGRWMKQMAPSMKLQGGFQRSRHRLLGEDALDRALTGRIKKIDSSTQWNSAFNESKHFWNEGPSKKKENLLLLDRIEEWLGRCRPAILGKEGAAAALDRGEKTLADILLHANDKEADSSDDQSEDFNDVKEGWIDGVGEGRNDEDNLSAYFRMSEGADEDSTWRADGLADLTKFENRAVIVGNADRVTLEETISSVDEGEHGKVKVLFDLVIGGGSGIEPPLALSIDVKRGSSLDVGMLHGIDHDARKRCSIEFWYRLPSFGELSEELVLARRSVVGPSVDIADVCFPRDNEHLLWELVLLPTGILEFRTSGGSTLKSTACDSAKQSNAVDSAHEFIDGDESTPESRGLVSWQRDDGGGGWNHVCLTFSSRDYSSPAECFVSVIMKGLKVASSTVSIVPPGLELDDNFDVELIDEKMERTALAFGVSPPIPIRLTELRIWSCERSEEDIKMMMYECLQQAETKKKFTMRIRSKREGSASSNKKSGALLAAPKEGNQTKRGRSGMLRPPAQDGHGGNSGRSGALISPLSEKPKEFGASFTNFDAFAGSNDDQNSGGYTKGFSKEPRHESVENALVGAQETPPTFGKGIIQSISREDQLKAMVPLSQQVRSSAAAALIRGPPATRHFGGNRGGLLGNEYYDGAGDKRSCIGAISICGAEKTVVYSHDQTPPGKTYPIGASGAIISDELDSQGSEFLCCFLAKDKRMVAFELTSRTVVVELQMTTKLNYWRYLPPEVHGHSLVFMLITPVGGFHWLPLDESPRPRQIWKRGEELQGKKIISYEEGGSNGLPDSESMSEVALLLASISSSGTPVEAWVVPVCGDSSATCLSRDVLGAAFCLPSKNVNSAFVPFVVTATNDNDDDDKSDRVIIEIRTLEKGSGSSFDAGGVIAKAILDCNVSEEDFASPTLAMGPRPEVIICCVFNTIVAAVRRKGLVAIYRLDGIGSNLDLVKMVSVDHFIVDAAVRCSRKNNEESAAAESEVVLLLCDNDSKKDGHVLSIFA